jgi:hypothetical protein
MGRKKTISDADLKEIMKQELITATDLQHKHNMCGSDIDRKVKLLECRIAILDLESGCDPAEYAVIYSPKDCYYGEYE